MNLIFKGRYGYMQNFETLEGLGKKTQCYKGKSKTI